MEYIDEYYIELDQRHRSRKPVSMDGMGMGQSKVEHKRRGGKGVR